MPTIKLKLTTCHALSENNLQACGKAMAFSPCDDTHAEIVLTQDTYDRLMATKLPFETLDDLLMGFMRSSTPN